MLNNPIRADNNSRGDHSKDLTAHNPTYPTAKAGYSYQTPYTMGLKKNKTPIEKAKDKPASLRLAINAMCFDCIGCGFDSYPQNEIRNCQIKDCSLWNVRPYQKKKPATKFTGSTAGQIVSKGDIK